MRKFGRNIRRLFLAWLHWGDNSANPYLSIIRGFAIYGIAGTLLLMLPFCHTTPIPFVDNLFNAVSALTTTGLATVNVSENYTFAGQFVMLVLMQLSGLGYMTLSTFIMTLNTKVNSEQSGRVVQTEFARPATLEWRTLLRNIVRFTVVFELAGIIVLYLLFLHRGVDNALWAAVFHSVSAFTTSGLSIFPNGFEDFASDYAVGITISVLSYLGAMGFILMSDVQAVILRRCKRLTFTSRVILVMTTAITVAGILYVMVFDYGDMDGGFGQRLFTAFFQVMSAMTTVGFNTVPIKAFSAGAVMLIMLTMYIGASPSGTGGGLKSTTVSALYGYIKGQLTNKRGAYVLGRRIPQFRVSDAVTTFILYTATFAIAVALLLTTEHCDPFALIFETIAALATAGLSMGVTADLTVAGKIIIIAVMFIGRIGVISIGTVIYRNLSQRNRKLKVEDIAV